MKSWRARNDGGSYLSVVPTERVLRRLFRHSSARASPPAGMEDLYYLAICEELQGMLARLKELARQDAVQELLCSNEDGTTALHLALLACPSLELLTAIWDVMKDDPLKTNLFAIVDDEGWYPLHYCACNTTSVDVLNFAIDKFPHALVRRSKNSGRTPLEVAQNTNPDRENYAAILRCLEESTARYPALLNQITAKCCLVEMKRNGMTQYVARTPLNDLTQPQFVFMVLDMMKNCMMHALAERILSYVGVNVGLPIKVINAGFEVKRLRQEAWDATQQQQKQMSEVKQQVSEVKQQVSEAAQQQQVAQLDDRISKLEKAMAEQEASRKRDHEAVMAALTAIRGLPADQGGDGGGPSKKRK